MFEHYDIRRGTFHGPGVRADVFCPRLFRLTGVRYGFPAVKDRT